MSCKTFRIGTPKIEQIEDTCFVDWHYKRVITKGLARGTHYASYYDKDCKEFSFWLTREHIKSIRAINTMVKEGDNEDNRNYRQSRRRQKNERLQSKSSYH